ncbi:MAG: AAA family ATPase [Deltaproteobacteria bacterium]|nr:AAA family ATPase [Deltaproteobacteria bacterium]
MLESGSVKIAVIPTGIPNLDPVLGGGLPELSTTVVGGLVGTGKTTLAQQISFHVGTPEHPTIYFTTLGEPTLKLLRYQQQFSFFDSSKVGTSVHIIDVGSEAADKGTIGALQEIGSHVERLSPRLVVVDSYRAIDDLSGGNPARWRLFTRELVELLAGWQCTALLLGEYTEEQVGVGPEFTVVDNVIYLSQEMHHNSVLRRLRVIKMRGQAPQPGRHAFRVLDRGLEVYPHLPVIADAPRRRKGGRASTGIPGLDEMMTGGIPRGQTCVVAGSSGVGKTLMALHFAVAGARAGEPCVMVTFEESPAEHAEKMAAFGWDLADLEKRGLIRMVYLRPVDLSLDEVMYTISAAVDDFKARRVVINSISGMETALPQTEQPELVEGLYRLCANLTARGLVVMLTTEVPDSFGGIRLSGQGLSFLSDNAILLRYVEIAGELRRALIIVKMRTSKHEGTLREYRIDAQGIVLDKSFRDYYGVLTGAPTLRAVQEPRPFTKGLAPNEEAAMNTLLSLKRADPQQVADALGSDLHETRHLLDRLEETGYVIRTDKDGAHTYRVALLAQPGPPGRKKV